jgi:hypothetical protein
MLTVRSFDAVKIFSQSVVHSQEINKVTMVVYNVDSESQHSVSSAGNDEDSMSWTESGEDDETNTKGDVTHGGNQTAVEISEIEELARYDTQMLRTWRIAVLIIIVGTFAAVTAGTCIFLKNQQENDNEQSVSESRCRRLVHTQKSYFLTPLTELLV